MSVAQRVPRIPSALEVVNVSQRASGSSRGQNAPSNANVSHKRGANLQNEKGWSRLSSHTKAAISYMLSDEGLMLLECYARDGCTNQHIANRFGMSVQTLMKVRKRHPSVDRALNSSREIVNYMVENALLKAALGHSARELKITTEIRNGKVVGKFKEEFIHDIEPDVRAIMYYLNNRLPDKWKKNRDTMLDLSEDDRIQISVQRARVDETGTVGTEIVVPAEDVPGLVNDEVEDVEPEFVEELEAVAADPEVSDEEERARVMEKVALERERERRAKYALAALPDETDDGYDSRNDPNSLDYWPEDAEV